MQFSSASISFGQLGQFSQWGWTGFIRGGGREEKVFSGQRKFHLRSLCSRASEKQTVKNEKTNEKVSRSAFNSLPRLQTECAKNVEIGRVPDFRRLFVDFPKSTPLAESIRNYITVIALSSPDAKSSD